MAEKYRLIGGTHYRRSPNDAPYRFDKGDVVELSPSELEAFGDKFEHASQKESLAEGGSIGAYEEVYGEVQGPAAAAPEPAYSEEAGNELVVTDDTADASLTRSEVINEFGEKLGFALIQGGFSTIASVDGATDEELLAVNGVGDASLKKIRS